MSNNKSIVESFEQLNKIVKLLIVIFVPLFSGIYRILRYVETKNIATLIAAIVSIITPLGVIIYVADIITEITSNRITLFAD